MEGWGITVTDLYASALSMEVTESYLIGRADSHVNLCH